MPKDPNRYEQTIVAKLPGSSLSKRWMVEMATVGNKTQGIIMGYLYSHDFPIFSIDIGKHRKEHVLSSSISWPLRKLKETPGEYKCASNHSGPDHLKSCNVCHAGVSSTHPLTWGWELCKLGSCWDLLVQMDIYDIWSCHHLSSKISNGCALF